MYLKYLGNREQITLKMPALVGGPYYIDGPGSVIKVDPVDGRDLVQNNPRMLMEVDKPPEIKIPKTKGDFLCHVCLKSFVTESGLKRHMRQMHGSEGGE